MSGALFLALVAVFATAMGGRDQLLVARLREALGPSLPLLLAGVLCASLSAAALAWAGTVIDAMISDAAETMLIAFALLAAAIELFWPHREKKPAEPTRSLFATAIVLLARQIGDGPRFVILAIAAATGAPLLTGLGGAIGGSAALAAGWAMGHLLESRLPLRAIRIGLGTAILVIAVLAALSARNIL